MHAPANAAPPDPVAASRLRQLRLPVHPRRGHGNCGWNWPWEGARGRRSWSTRPSVARNTEALERVLSGRTKAVGVVSAGEVFDALDFLHALDLHVTLGLHV